VAEGEERGRKERVRGETQRRPPGTIDKSKIVITRDGSNDNEDADDDVDDDAEDVARQ